MPRFERVEVAARAPASVPVVVPSPRALRAGTGQALERLGGVLTELGVARAREATRLRQTRAVTEAETVATEAIGRFRVELKGLTDSDAIAERTRATFEAIDRQINDLREPAVRETVRSRLAGLSVAAKVDAEARRFALEVDQNRAALDGQVTALERLAVAAPDEGSRTHAARLRDQRYAEGVQGGYLTREEATDRRQVSERRIGRGRAALLLQEDPTALRALLEDPTSELSHRLEPEDRASFLGAAREREQVERERVLRAQSQRDTDPIVRAIQAGEILKLNVAVEQAKRAAGDDAERRDLNVARITHEWALHRQSEAEALADVFQTATELVETTKTTNGIPMELWLKFTPAQREALETRATQLLTPEEPEPLKSDRAYLDFWAQPPAAIAALTADELWTRWRLRLTDRHWAGVQAAWVQARQSTGSVALTATLSFHEQIRHALAEAGLVDPGKTPAQWSDEQATGAARVTQAAALALERFELTKGRPATLAERQAVIDEVLLPQVFRRRAFRTDRPVPAAIARRDDDETWYVPLSALAPEQRRETVNFLRSWGVVELTRPEAEALRTYQRRIEDAWGARYLGASLEEIQAILTGGRARPALTFPESP